MTFHRRIRALLADPELAANLRKALVGTAGKRERAIRFPEYEALRERAADVRLETLDRLPALLDEFERNARAAGIEVVRAVNAVAACEAVAGILERQGAKLVVKGKSMVTEEIGLNAFLAKRGIVAVETDLGEYIVQLRGEAPSHITAPAIHLNRRQVAATFREKLGYKGPDDPPALTAFARERLREQFLSADAGICGVNLAIADAGRFAVIENEGNCGLVTSVPPLLIAVMGMERIVPTLDDFLLLHRLIPANATGQDVNCFTHLLGGSTTRRPYCGDSQGSRPLNGVRGETPLGGLYPPNLPPKGVRHPWESQCSLGFQRRFVVIVDNGRSALLASPVRAAAACVRCGACMVHCPVYGKIGGHGYGAVYPGPIGIIVARFLLGAIGPLSYLCTLCGRCDEVCPVKVPLSDLILASRAAATNRKPLFERLAFRGHAWFIRRPHLYHLAARTARTALRLFARFGGRGWLMRHRIPIPPARAFSERYRNTGERK